MKSGRDPLTVRFPSKLLDQTRTVKRPGESLNDVVVSALEREVRRRTALELGTTILRTRDEMLASGPRTSSSIDLIHELREDRRRDG
jgi:hypothetical protein